LGLLAKKLNNEAMAVDAVSCEPVSATKFPDNRENTGNFSEIGGHFEILQIQ
jgi:hypothetical protein